MWLIMEFNEFKEKMIINVDKLGINLSEIQLKQFYNYMNLLIEWNKKINLTAITEPDEIILKHFVDSLTISKYISDGTKVVDVGTGAGFPGIPLKIVRQEIDITLLDSLQKRINFLDEVINELNLEKITTVHSRVEDFGKNKEYREKFDIATSRAVANLSTLSEYLLPLVKVGGKVISMKGSLIQEELENSKNAIKILGGQIEKVDEFDLPNSDISRNIVLIDKIKNTPNRYPRKAGEPSKKPL